jgi:hypothetical protein
MTPIEKLRRIADSTALDGVADAIREVADEMDWRPIETAPKDGTRILIATPLDGVMSSEFFGGLWQNIPWRREGAARGQPTHWMPLPPAPKGAE